MRDNFKYRNTYIQIFVILATAVLVGQLVNLQIIKDYSDQADEIGRAHV